MNLNFSDNQNIKEAQDFLQLVLEPPVNEVGLIADVRSWRMDNQVEIIKRAEVIVKQRTQKTRKVPLKLLADLLEQCSLEEDESLRAKWATLFANTVIENSQINSTIYAHILGQMTKLDAEIYELVYRLSTQTEKSTKDSPHEFKITFARSVSIKKVDLQKVYKESYLYIENLIRLRLIKEVVQHSLDSDSITMTDLGFRFMGVVNDNW